MRERAHHLGDAHARKGENAVAADFFDIAGDSSRASENRKKAKE